MTHRLTVIAFRPDVEKKVKHFYFTTVTAKLEVCMLAVDLSVLPPAKLVPTSTAR